MNNINTVKNVNSVLIIESDKLYVSSFKSHLVNEGYHVDKVALLAQAKGVIFHNPPDLVIVDHNLSDQKQINELHLLRAMFKGPIMVVTTNTSEQVQINCFNAGADDYLIKPFSFNILNVRVSALLRRKNTSFNGDDVSKIEVGDITLYPLSQKCQVKDKGVHLSTFEFRLLGLLLSNAGKIMSRDSIYNLLLGRDYNGAERTVDVRVSKLRDKLASIGVEHAKIETVWGQGYILNEIVNQKYQKPLASLIS